MSFCVVAIHTNPLINCSSRLVLSIYDSVVELAVPFFFIVSGFLLAQKFDGKNNTTIIYKQMKKILKMYLIWNLIYSPLEIYHSMSVLWNAFSEGSILLYPRFCFCWTAL